MLLFLKYLIFQASKHQYERYAVLLFVVLCTLQTVVLEILYLICYLLVIDENSVSVLMEFFVTMDANRIQILSADLCLKEG